MADEERKGPSAARIAARKLAEDDKAKKDEESKPGPKSVEPTSRRTDPDQADLFADREPGDPPAPMPRDPTIYPKKDD